LSSTIDIDLSGAALKGERSKLVHQLNELGADESGDLNGEVDYGDAFADAAAATAERTEVIGLVDTLKLRLDDVDAALAKVNAGTYGRCDSCGKPIDATRLASRPESRFCIDCKSRR